MGLTASFDEAGVKNQFFYDKKDYWVCNMKRYEESGMSREVRQQVKSTYYDYKINGITEIIVPGKVVYLLYYRMITTLKRFRLPMVIWT